MWKIVLLFAFGCVLLGSVLGAYHGRPVSSPHSTLPFLRTQNHIVISGAYISAASLAYQDWLQHVSKGKYKAVNQSTIIDGTRGNIYVRFVPRSDNTDGFGGETRFGIETLYVIDPSGSRILGRSFGE